MRLSLPRRETKTQRTQQKGEEPRYLPQLACAVAAFLFAGLRAVDDFSPFAAAFLAASPVDALAGCFLGGALGLFAAQPWQTALRHVGALVLIAAFRLTIERRFSSLRRMVVLPAVTVCAVLSCGLSFLAFTGVSAYALMLLAAECAAAGLCCALFLRALQIPVRALGIAHLSAQDSALLGLCGCLLLACAASYEAFGVSPARIAACFAVLFFSYQSGAKGGAVAGLCAGASLSVLPGTRFLLALYAVPGLVSGVFSPLGQAATALFFALTAALGAFLGGFDSKTLWCLAEIGVACVAFSLVPSKRLEQLRELLKKKGLLADEQTHFYASANLLRAASQVSQVSQVIQKTSGRLDRVLNPELNLIFSKLQQNVCLGCPRKTACWHDRYEETASDVLTIAGMQEDADEETALEDRCPRFGALKTQIGQSYIDFVSGLAAKEKLRELRGVVTDQFDTLADFLEEVASLVRGSRVVDSNRSRTLRTALADAGQYVDALHYFTDPSGRASVEITMLEDAFSLDFGLIRKKLETLTGRQFAPEEIAILDLRTVVTFWERAAFRVLCGRAQIPLAASGVSGDCVGTLQDPGGRSVALLSDGMGTGARAAVDSVLTATLLEKLLKSGFAFPGALKLVNCALLVKSSDESIATADGLVVNVYTGQADLYKAGAAASFWRQGDRVTQIEAPSLPIGILRKVGLAHRTLQLAAGDIVLLVSDGVTAQDCGWLNDELLAWSTNNMDDLASHIASLAKLRSDEETRDDITVVAVKLLENRG